MSKATSKKFSHLIGLHKSKGIVKIKDTICFRKPVGISRTREIMSRHKYAIGMVSSHNIYRKPNTPYCNVWCHCYRDPKLYLKNKPALLLSESDFVDPRSIPVLLRSRSPKWDFFYFTIGGELGDGYKGFRVFLKSLPILCGKYKLKGIVIKYAKQKVRFTKPIPAKYNNYIKKLRKKIVPGRIAKIMSQCRFGFFPNIMDCSPLMLSESIVRDCPVLINEDILGGWKYGDSNVGLLFNMNNLEEKINLIMENEFHPNEAYMQHYGYRNTAKRMANFCKKHIPSFNNLTMIAFSKTESTMRKYEH